MTRPPTSKQLQTLRELRERIKAIQDEVHDIRYPDNSSTTFAKSILFGGAPVVWGLEETLEGIHALLGAARSQVEALADGALPREHTTVWDRATARARSLPPERDVPDGEGDASHTVPALATVKGAR